MLCHTLYGFEKEAVQVIFQDTAQRITVLQHISKQNMSDDLKTNVLLDKNIQLPETSSPSNVDIVSVFEICKQNSLKSTVSNFTPDGSMNKNFGRKMKNTKGENTGSKELKLSKEEIQQMNDEQIKEQKIIEDLHVISSCLNQILKGIEDKASFEVLLKYIKEKNEEISKMTVYTTSGKKTEKVIVSLKTEIENTKAEYGIKLQNLKTLISHLKHQKQEQFQKNQMEYNFILAKTHSKREELKLQFKADENQISNDCKEVENLIDKEDKVNIRLLMFFRNSIQTMEQNIDYWTKVYKVETHKSHSMVKNITKEFQNLKTELEGLVTKYVSYEKVCTENRIFKGKQAELEKIAAFYTSNALMIQNWWRFICVMLSIGPHDPRKKAKKEKKKPKK